MTGAIAALAALKSGDVINIEDVTVTAGSVIAEYALEADGDVSKNEDGVVTDLGDWITPKSHMTDYEVRATVVSGSLSSGTTGSWLALGSLNRTWSKSAAGTVVLTIEIRDTATSTVRDSATITLIF